MTIYTFDLAQLQHADGHTTQAQVDKYQAHPFVQRGWLDEQTKRTQDQYRYDVIESSFTLTAKGRELIRSFHAWLESRFPGDRWYVYDVNGLGKVTLYDMGIDVPSEWTSIFGPRAGWATEPHKLPDGWRPWLNPSATTPTCFIDTQDERYPWVDSMGVSGMGNNDLTPYVSMLYALRTPQSDLVLRLERAGVLGLFEVNLK